MRRVFLITLIGIAAVLLFPFLGRTPHEREIEIHLRKLESATYCLSPPTNWKEALTWKRLRARFTAGAFQNNPGSVMEDERNKLVELGYFQRRTLTLANAKLMREFSATSQIVTFLDMNWSYSHTGGTNIILTAFTGDMPKWEQIVSNLNSTVVSGNAR